MRTTSKFKSIIVIYSIVFAMYAPFSTAAGPITSSFLGKDRLGQMGGDISENGTFFFALVSAFESVSQSNSKTTVAGAYFNGEVFRGAECWTGFGVSESNIQFDASGKLPQQVTTSGTILVLWNEYCTGSNAEFTETITFSGSLSGIREHGTRYWGNTHRKDGDGNYQLNTSYDNTVSAATASNLSISSPTFGTIVTPDESWCAVGNSRYHSVEYVKF